MLLLWPPKRSWERQVGYILNQPQMSPCSLYWLLICGTMWLPVGSCSRRTWWFGWMGFELVLERRGGAGTPSVNSVQERTSRCYFRVTFSAGHNNTSLFLNNWNIFRVSDNLGCRHLDLHSELQEYLYLFWFGYLILEFRKRLSALQ